MCCKIKGHVCLSKRIIEGKMPCCLSRPQFRYHSNHFNTNITFYSRLTIYNYQRLLLSKQSVDICTLHVTHYVRNNPIEFLCDPNNSLQLNLISQRKLYFAGQWMLRERYIVTSNIIGKL